MSHSTCNRWRRCSSREVLLYRTLGRTPSMYRISLPPFLSLAHTLSLPPPRSLFSSLSPTLAPSLSRASTRTQTNTYIRCCVVVPPKRKKTRSDMNMTHKRNTLRNTATHCKTATYCNSLMRMLNTRTGLRCHDYAGVPQEVDELHL